MLINVCFAFLNLYQLIRIIKYTSLMIRKYFIALCLMSGVSHTVTDAAETIWEIGKSDRSAQEFALAPDGFKRFLAEDFGYEDKFFMLGKSVEEKDFPYILPGPADT